MAEGGGGADDEIARRMAAMQERLKGVADPRARGAEVLRELCRVAVEDAGGERLAGALLVLMGGAVACSGDVPEKYRVAREPRPSAMDLAPAAAATPAPPEPRRRRR